MKKIIIIALVIAAVTAFFLIYNREERLKEEQMAAPLPEAGMTLHEKFEPPKAVQDTAIPMH